MEDSHHKYIVEETKNKKTGRTGRELDVKYHKAGDENSLSKNRFALRNLKIIEEDKTHFFEEELFFLEKKVGVARAIVTNDQKKNLVHDDMKNDLIDYYLIKGKPEQLFIQKNVNILSAT